jgi:hypothetical protein
MSSFGILRRVALIRTDVTPKLRFLQEPHGVIPQKMVFCIFVLLEFSSVMFYNLCAVLT